MESVIRASNVLPIFVPSPRSHVNHRIFERDSDGAALCCVKVLLRLTTSSAVIYQRSSTHPYRCQVYARRSHEARIDGKFLIVGHDFVAGTSEARGHSKGERGEGESINTMGDSRWIAGAEALAGGRPTVLASNYSHACVQRDLSKILPRPKEVRKIRQ